MRQITITEALAERKLVDKRIDKKRDFIGQYVLQPANIIDPFAKDGGSVVVLAKELQGVTDLESNKITIMRAIAASNAKNEITVDGETRSIADWLVWRRDVLPKRREFLQGIAQGIQRQRQQLLKQNVTVKMNGEDSKPSDVLVNISESKIAGELEHLETVDGTLDGLLSLKNATLLVDIEG